MQLTATILAALLNTGALALPPDTSHKRAISSGPCPEFANNPLCYESSLLGVVYSGCKAPIANVTSGADLHAICVSQGNIAKCCPDTYVGYGIGCEDPEESSADTD
ncbi:Cerato-ulmin [Cytospora mali]|uniref:Cerato-ulmin n=1 Tax=Cytospora mali TaxID=578113 RepID=A0A194UMZ2_CYTMA|nr:Cerato-ulmin [Valsa mali var. pyri (nom. inval.)]